MSLNTNEPDQPGQFAVGDPADRDNEPTPSNQPNHPDALTGSADGRAEEQLKSEQDFISAVLDTVAALIVVLDGRGRIVLFNQACSQATGYSFDEVRGRHVWDILLIPEEVEPVKQVFDQLRAGTFPNKHVNYWVTKDGKRRLISWSNTALVGGQGSVEYVIGTGIDVTEREMLESQLRQSQKMEAVGRLAGGVAHDFGSVLTAITGYAARALQHFDKEHAARKDLQGVLRASERAADLIRRLLIFSRRQTLEPRVLNLNHVVANVNAMLQRVIGEDIELTSKLSADSAHVKADRSQLEQVLLNLAVNARDAMPRGGALSIETEDVDLDEEKARTHGDVAPGSYVMLSVSDTGEGIDEHNLSRVFEPFFTTKEEGTGLGLSTVYGIVKQSGGHIWVESKPYLGTSFKIYLPRVDAAAEEEGLGAMSDASLAGSETVLVVEDDEDVRTVVCRTLRQHGYTVWGAAGPEEALRICDERRDPVHLVLSDVILPRMGGPKLTRILTSLRPGIKVLYMSGYTGSASDGRNFLRPDERFLEKPFTPDTLARKVREVLDSS